MNRTGSELLHTMLLATSALVASTMLTSSGALAGGPTGGKVVVGTATITTPSSTQTVVNQTSQKALINWNSFSVPTGSSITFDQPNTSSLAVNRVTGPNASAIDGQLLANGNIWLINANGIMFGHGSQVDVGALLATTSDLSDDAFRKGRYRFTKPGNPGASVVNQGSITAAQGGSVVLSGSQVSNQGIVQANLGTVVLGGANAFTVDLDGDNLLRYQITAPVTAPPKGAPQSGSALVSNSGTIAAAGGRILLTARAAKNVQDDVINNTGQIEATSVSSHDGEIDFDAGSNGTVDVGGTVNASGTGAGQTGGAVNVAGGTVNVANGATINASGDVGGGAIQIGGGLHGKGTIANSNATNVGSATISANAITKGNGGTIAIWSNGTTNFAGTASAVGGAQGGNGGLVETSGGNVNVGLTGKVITSAAKGQTGDWLIDPTNIDIVTGGTDGIGGSNISPTTVINALGSTNVTLEATNDITISDAVDYSSSNTLSLLASQDIIANASVQNSGTGAINLIAGWDGETTNLSQLTNAGVYGNNNGSITIGGENANGNVAVGSAGGTTTFAAANLTIEADNGYAQAGYHGAGGGNLVADLTGNLALTANSGEGGYAQFGNGSLNGDISGNVTGNISINAVGGTTVNLGEGGGTGWIGNFASEGSVESGNVSLVTAGLDDQQGIGGNVAADLGSTSVAGSGGDFLIGLTGTDLDAGGGGHTFNSPHTLTLLSVDNINLDSSIQNSGAGNINIVAGWDGSTTSLPALTNAGVYGNNGGSITIGGENGFGNVAVGSAGGTTTFAAADLTIEADNGFAQAGYHGAGGGNLVADLTGDLTLTAYSGEGGYAQFGNGSLDGDVSGNITGNISINVVGTTTINIGEGGGTAWIGNFAGESSIESGNVTLITGVGHLGHFGTNAAADLGSVGQPGSGGDVLIGLTNQDVDISNESLGAIDTSHNFTLLSVGSVNIGSSIQNSGSGNINLIAGWDGTTTNLSALTNAGVYGNNGGSITIGGENANGNVAVGSAGGTTTFAAADLTIEADNGFAQAGYHGAGGGNLVADLTGNLTLTAFSGEGGYAQFGNGSLNNDVSGNITGNISINAAGTTTINIGEGGGTGWIGNFAGEGSIESGNLSLITGEVQNSGSFGGPDSIGAMLIADLGTTSAAGSGGNVTFALTKPTTDFINSDLDFGAIEYNSPNSLMLLSTGNFTLPYSIQNDGAGNLTILAGWNPAVAPANVLATPGAYGNLTTDENFEGGTYTAGADVWVVGETGNLHDYNPNSDGGLNVDSGAGAAIGSMGGTTTIGAAQIYVEGLSGYAQIGYHNSGGTGAINVIANGVPGTGGLTGISACFDGDANICVIGGRSGDTDKNNDPTYAQIGDLGLGVAGTASSNINVTATGNIAVAGGGIYDNTDNPSDPQIPDAYGMIGNGDGAQTVAQTVSGTIIVNDAGQLNFASSEGTGSDAWLGNRTGTGGLFSGNLTVVAGSENDSGPVDFGEMIFADLGAGGGSGGNVVVGFTDPGNTLKIDSNVSYSSSNSLEVLSVSNIAVESTVQNSGTGDITLVAGWDGHTLGTVSQLGSANAYGQNGGTVTIGGSNASGDAAIGTAGGTMSVLTDTLDVESENGIAQLGYSGAGAGNINVVALGNVTVDALNGTYAQIGNGGSAVSGNVAGAIGVSSGGTVLVESDSGQSDALIGNVGGATSSESGSVTVAATALDINSAGGGSNAFVGNGSVIASTGGATGAIAVTAGDVSIDASSDGSDAFIGDGVRFKSSGTTGGNINVNATTLEIVANEGDGDTSEARIANRGAGNVVGTYDIVTTGNIQISALNGNLAAIGNGENGTGTSSGNLTVQSGGTLTLASTDSGETRIGNGAATNSTVDVSAVGDIDLSVTGNPGESGSGSLLIGNLGGAAGGNVSVTSSGGSIDLNAAENGSAIQIGNIQNGATANVSGNIVVSAQDNVTLEAAGQNTVVQIGNGGLQTQGNDTGSVGITATTGEIAATLNGDGGFIQLGNGGNASSGSATGNTSLSAGTSVQLAVGGSAADSGSYIQVGDGAAFDATSGGGNITVNAASMSTSNSVDFVGNSLGIALSGAGNSIGADGELRVTVNDLALDTNNGSAFIYSTQGISLGAGEGGINLGTGGLDITAAGAISQTNAITAGSVAASTSSGAITLTNASNAITLVNLATSGSDDATLYDTSALTMTGAYVGGNLTLLTKGNLTFTDSATAGGAILAVAGWDGTTTTPSALTTGTAYGNNGGSITVGGASQDGNVAIGSASGSTTLAADNVSLTANNGFVQVGYNGAGSGDIDIVASGNVALTAGTQKDEFAQIGNGGWNISGNESGSITVDAVGTVALNGGSGQETYAQIGHGGTASNSGSEGYSDAGLITVDGQSVTLAAGSSQGSYSQIGNGGYQSGQNSSGTLTLGGDININAVDAVTLTGNGQDAYAQIGNGGDFVNTGAANGATGTISGDIDVSVTDASNHTSPDPVTAKAGTGADSYAQIGNGGNGENTPAEGATVTFNVSGNVTVADLTLEGSDTGQDGYAQVGNGDASKTGTGNISGDVTIGPGIDVTIDNGTAPGTDTMIGNDTGFGSVTGSITGYTPGSTNPITAGANGSVASTTQTAITPTDTDVNVITVTPENNGDNPSSNNPPAPINQPPGPLDQLADNGNSEGSDPSDALTSSLGQSLDPRAHNAPITVVKSIIPGVLSQVVMKDPHGPHGVPPADEDYSSWGNEALWQW